MRNYKLTVLILLTACNSGGGETAASNDTERVSRETPSKGEKPTPQDKYHPSIAFVNNGDTDGYKGTSQKTVGTGIGQVQAVEFITNDSTQDWQVSIIYDDGAENRYLKSSGYGTHNFDNTDNIVCMSTGYMVCDVAITNFQWIGPETAQVEVCIAQGLNLSNCTVVQRDFIE